MRPLENRWLVLAVLTSAAMHSLVVYWPLMASVFHYGAASPLDWALVLFFSGWSQILESLLVKVRRVWVRRISVVRV